MKKIPQAEYDKVIKAVEKNTCFRFTAGVNDSSAFMIPVSKDGKTPLGEPILFSWKQLKEMSALRRPKSLI